MAFKTHPLCLRRFQRRCGSRLWTVRPRADRAPSDGGRRPPSWSACSVGKALLLSELVLHALGADVIGGGPRDRGCRIWPAQLAQKLGRFRQRLGQIERIEQESSAAVARMNCATPARLPMRVSGSHRIGSQTAFLSNQIGEELDRQLILRRLAATKQSPLLANHQARSTGNALRMRLRDADESYSMMPRRAERADEWVACRWRQACPTLSISACISAFASAV